MATEPADTDTYVLMAGSDRYSQEIREELARRRIGFVEVDVAAGRGVVLPTLVVNLGQGSPVRYSGYGRIKQEFLSRLPQSALS